MSNTSPGPQKVEILSADGKPVDGSNPLPVVATFSGTVGKVDQGAAGTAAAAWWVQPTADGSTVSLPLPAGAATSAAQATGNASLSSIDAKLSNQATAVKQDAQTTLLGGGLPAALASGRLDVSIGASPA